MHGRWLRRTHKVTKSGYLWVEKEETGSGIKTKGEKNQI